MTKTFLLTSSCLQTLMKSKLQFYSLSIGEKKTSEAGLVLLHLYSGTGFPALDLHVRVTFPFSTGFPDTEHLGTAGGTEEKHGSCQRFWVCCHFFIQTLKFRRLELFLTLHIKNDLNGITSNIRNDDLTHITAGVRLPGVVDVQRNISRRHGLQEPHAAPELGAALVDGAFDVADDLYRRTQGRTTTTSYSL